MSIDVRQLCGRAEPARRIEDSRFESDYKRSFFDGTGFDYKRDLDSVVASFSGAGNFFIARGRFDWAKLRAYAVREGGSCYKDLCRIQGSKPERHISFLPLRDDAIALAVSTNDLAATQLTKTGQPITAAIPINSCVDIRPRAVNSAVRMPCRLKCTSCCFRL